MTTSIRSADVLFTDGTTQTSSAIVMASSAALGAVGTYGMFRNLSGVNLLPGDTVAGSNLYWSNAYGAGWYCYTGTSPSGTWRCMGYSRYNGNQDRQTAFMRIS